MEVITMSRFMDELLGDYGPYWKNEAEKHVERMKEDLKSGEITVDEFGLARNCIGRYLMDDLLEIAHFVNPNVNVELTRAYRNMEDIRLIKEYKKNHKISDEERQEIRNEFGGKKVIDVLTGEYI